MTDGADIRTPRTAPTGFSVEVKRDHETAELIPVGEVDLSTVGQLEHELETLIAAGFARIVIDLRRVAFLDSTGVHALISAQVRADQDGWQLAIAPGPRHVQRIFEITGVVDRLPFIRLDGAAKNSQNSDGGR